MDPVRNPEAYDFFLLAGQRSPGVCHMGEPSRELGWDIVEAKGADGAETVNNGEKLARFTCDLFLWADEYRDEYVNYDQWKSLVLVPGKDGAQQQALDIWHPLLEGLGITSVVVAKRSEPIPDGLGGATVHLEFLEYKAPKKKTGSGKPNGSKAGGGWLPPITPGAGGLNFGDGTSSTPGGGTKGVSNKAPKAEKPPAPQTNVDKKAELKAAMEENRRVRGGG